MFNDDVNASTVLVLYCVLDTRHVLSIQTARKQTNA